MADKTNPAPRDTKIHYGTDSQWHLDEFSCFSCGDNQGAIITAPDAQGRGTQVGAQCDGCGDNVWFFVATDSVIKSLELDWRPNEYHNRSYA